VSETAGAPEEPTGAAQVEGRGGKRRGEPAESAVRAAREGGAVAVSAMEDAASRAGREIGVAVDRSEAPAEPLAGLAAEGWVVDRWAEGRWRDEREVAAPAVAVGAGAAGMVVVAHPEAVASREPAGPPVGRESAARGRRGRAGPRKPVFRRA